MAATEAVETQAPESETGTVPAPRLRDNYANVVRAKLKRDFEIANDN